MPYKSDKQRKFFHASGAVPPEVVREFDRASRKKTYPAKPKKRRK